MEAGGPLLSNPFNTLIPQITWSVPEAIILTVKSNLEAFCLYEGYVDLKRSLFLQSSFYNANA